MSNEAFSRFTSEEWGLFGNALNEVINGLKVPDFERTIGADKASLRKLLRHLHTLGDADELALGMKETRAVRNALLETIRRIGAWEFHTRTGYEVERAKAILQRLDSMLAERG